LNFGVFAAGSFFSPKFKVQTLTLVYFIEIKVGSFDFGIFAAGSFFYPKIQGSNFNLSFYSNTIVTN
jgi:hypothetical protein